ncbi:uncharacterized protein BXZ73DRAFT_81783 [Epithele typhae]|uniref:uncharacterized protein n=1 Tax=Epithele typhae TaxID=378194 RepID=UPI0020089A52|nr:uncharacterized protein BXZ73DRAFT_81783 [Epithele typhae]KAH9913981.1 hypothetical protein BXZ73DRAFT_81783 [Epithele typhae]
MPALDADASRFLAPRKSPSRQTLGRKTSASFRSPSSLGDALSADDANGRHSLAHELAAALLPEPSAGSKLLAEEFGIEYDEGAEGIDGLPADSADGTRTPTFHEDTQFDGLPDTSGAESLASQLNGASRLSPARSHHDSPLSPAVSVPDIDPDFRSPQVSPTAAVRPHTPSRRSQPEQQDPMAILAADLEYTERFLAQLRRLDSGEPSGAPSAPASASPPAPSSAALEKLASDVIRRINDAARDREGQLRELLECEREFRKIAGEVGGNDALAVLPELEDLVRDEVHPAGPSSARAPAAAAASEAHEPSAAAEDPNDWEVDPDRALLGDAEDEHGDPLDDPYGEPQYSPTPAKSEFPPIPPVHGPATPAAALPLLVNLRTFTASTASSLATISEHTQVNAAATTEAGRKIRALKNKLGGWRTEWDSAERSRVRIERWEAGIVDGDTPPTGSTSPPRLQRRVDGRKIVQEHLEAFEKALTEAHTKTQAIIAAVS